MSLYGLASRLVLGPAGLGSGPACAPLLPPSQALTSETLSIVAARKTLSQILLVQNFYLFINTLVLEQSPTLCKLSRWQPGLSILRSLGEIPSLSLTTHSHTLWHLSLGALVLSSLPAEATSQATLSFCPQHHFTRCLSTLDAQWVFVEWEAVFTAD